MARQFKRLGLIIALISIALAGLLVVQTLLLNSAYQSKADSFRRNALSALHSTVQRLAASEALSLAIDFDDSTGKGRASIMAFDEERIGSDSSIRSSYSYYVDDGSPPKLFWMNNDSIHFNLPHDQRVQLKAVGIDSSEFTIFLDTFARAGMHSIGIDAEIFPESPFEWEFTTEDSSYEVSKSEINRFRVAPPESGNHEFRMVVVQSVLNRLDSADHFPIETRVDLGQLDSLLTISLEEAGIEIAPLYGVNREGQNELILTNTDDENGNKENILASDLSAILFPLDFSGRPSRLRLYFPDQSSYILKQMTPLVVPTIVLIMIIIAAFAYSTRTILVQRRFATTLVDFVNNMTHEFKTPISTVQLACEAINRDEVAADPEKVRRFNSMILSESRRMKDQSDKILQMALLERREYELKREPTDIDELIQSVIDSFSLRVTETGGAIDYQMSERSAVMNVDPIYFANILHNLLDNAVKYSKDAPKISVRTNLDSDNYAIEIADNGIGIEKKSLGQVFERYYRVHQGDRHDVKGFGLGLSFVKLMVEAHGGMVTMTSEPGIGTKVTIRFPAAMIEENHNG